MAAICQAGRQIRLACNFARREQTASLQCNRIYNKYLRKYNFAAGHLARYLHFLSRKYMDMVSTRPKLDEVNVLASGANWAWPEALHNIFRPRGVNLLVAESPAEFVNIIERRRIHTTIVDMDSEKSNGLTTIKVIRMDYPLLPCILLTSTAGEDLLGKALRFNVFSVIDKPVDMNILREQLNKLFIKKYNSDIFAK